MTLEITREAGDEVPEMKRVALITGSGRRRVGSVVARSLAELGYSVALHYHKSREPAEESAAEFQKRGCDAEAFQADVSSEDEVDAMFERVLARFGRLDVLVTTASVWTTMPLEDIRESDLRRHLGTDLIGTFLCARRAGLMMAGQQEGGAIVTIGDWAIERPYRDHAAYFLAKGAIPTLTRVLAVELAHRNPRVRVNCIHPGPVMFPPDADSDEREQLVASTLVKQGDCPDSISKAVKFFIDNEFVTGVCLPVDGGRSIYSAESDQRSRPM